MIGQNIDRKQSELIIGSDKALKPWVKIPDICFVSTFSVASEEITQTTPDVISWAV